jgi:Prenyltransferase and squalene oxidase repeat
MTRRSGLRMIVAIGSLGLLVAGSSAQEPADAATFAEARTGEVPEGTAELLTPETLRAISDGLEWLDKHQAADGSFGAGAYRGNIAVTSLAGLAMMASGSSPGRGPHGKAIDRALNYVMEHTEASGFINVSEPGTHGPMYSHGFGALFLAEAYGMTHRPEIREKLERAVRVILDSQNEEGGWRYQPIKSDADLSVTICQINALRAARNAGLYVPKETVLACIEYVKKSQNEDGGFRYMMRGGASAFPRSAAGVVALYSAAVYEDDAVNSGIDYLRQFTPEARAKQPFNHYFYGHYYAVQAMWIRGGEDWNRWFPAVRDELIGSQAPQGFWTDNVGSDYATAMALIILQVPNNYLPIFQR